MRFPWTVVGAAILIVVSYLLLSWIVDGYFGGHIYPDDGVINSWAAPDSWSNWRDIVIVIMGVFWAIAGMLAIADQLAAHPHPAAIDTLQVVDAGQQRALARSGLADDAHHRPRPHLHVDAAQHFLGAEPLAQPPDANHRLGHAPRP